MKIQRIKSGYSLKEVGSFVHVGKEVVNTLWMKVDKKVSLGLVERNHSVHSSLDAKWLKNPKGEPLVEGFLAHKNKIIIWMSCLIILA